MNFKKIVAVWLFLTLTTGMAWAELQKGDYLATHDSKFITNTLALPITKDNIFFIDRTLLYFGFDVESNLFRRYIKRATVESALNNTDIDRTITAKQAIEKENTDSQDTLADLLGRYYDKFLDIRQIHEDESPWEDSRSEKYVQIAPSLWTNRESYETGWGKPGVYMAYRFVVKIDTRNVDGFVEGFYENLPLANIELALNDGRYIKFKCDYHSQHGLKQKANGVAYSACSDGKWLNEGIIAFARDFSANKGEMKTSFTKSADSQRYIFLKEPHKGDVDLVNSRVETAIEQSSCSERNECASYYKRRVINSFGHWLSDIKNLSVLTFAICLVVVGAIFFTLQRLSGFRPIRIAITLSFVMIASAGYGWHIVGNMRGAGWGGLYVLILIVVACFGGLLGCWLIYWLLKVRDKKTQIGDRP